MSSAPDTSPCLWICVPGVPRRVVRLHEEPVVIGRNSNWPTLAPRDKLVSSRQLRVSISHGGAIIERLGINPSYYRELGSSAAQMPPPKWNTLPLQQQIVTSSCTIEVALTRNESQMLYLLKLELVNSGIDSAPPPDLQAHVEEAGEQLEPPSLWDAIGMGSEDEGDEFESTRVRATSQRRRQLRRNPLRPLGHETGLEKPSKPEPLLDPHPKPPNLGRMLSKHTPATHLSTARSSPLRQAASDVDSQELYFCQSQPSSSQHVPTQAITSYSPEYATQTEASIVEADGLGTTSDSDTTQNSDGEESDYLSECISDSDKQTRLESIREIYQSQLQLASAKRELPRTVSTGRRGKNQRSKARASDVAI